MAWYSIGTASVTSGSKTVTGSNTSWYGGLQKGWGFVGPDGRAYEIAEVVSATELTLKTDYLGSTGSGQPYAAFPTMSLAADLTEAVLRVISDYKELVTVDGDKITLGDGDLILQSGNATGAAVQSGPTDDAAGKLMLAEFGYSPANTLGTVSQSGGTPTGAIIERGSNANGEFIRWADGTQICIGQVNLGSIKDSGNGSYGSPYYTNNVSADFASAFIGLPTVSLQWAPGGGAFNTLDRMIQAAPYSITTSNLGSVRAWNTAGSATNNDVVIKFTAIGRWF